MMFSKKSLTKKVVKKAAVKAVKKSAVKKPAARKKRRIRQTLERFHVIAVQQTTTNLPYDTPGWTATLTRGTITLTAEFDDFGVARFNNIPTLTTVGYTLRIFDEANNQLTQKSVPSGLEVYVARFNLPT
ncbi:hypothetical protein [Paenibacillus methanolicus]|nr:hypothetical protein [Paenibacillus methanolicus]